MISGDAQMGWKLISLKSPIFKKWLIPGKIKGRLKFWHIGCGGTGWPACVGDCSSVHLTAPLQPQAARPAPGCSNNWKALVAASGRRRRRRGRRRTGYGSSAETQSVTVVRALWVGLGTISSTDLMFYGRLWFISLSRPGKEFYWMHFAGSALTQGRLGQTLGPRICTNSFIFSQPASMPVTPPERRGDENMKVQIN